MAKVEVDTNLELLTAIQMTKLTKLELVDGGLQTVH